MTKPAPGSSVIRHRPDAASVRAVVFVVLAAVGSQACTPIGGPGPAPPEPPPAVMPALEDGGVSTTEALRAANLLREARDYLAAESFLAAAAAAREIVEDYPRAPGSAEALLLLAEADLGLGEVREAADAAEAFRQSVQPDHPSYPRAGFLLASALARLGDDEEAARVALDATTNEESSFLEAGKGVLRDALPNLTAEALSGLASSTEASHPLLDLVAAEASVAFYLEGDEDRAREWARRALRGTLDDRERTRARAVLTGDREELLGRPVVLGAMLPGAEASPTLQQYGAWILEGIEVAIEEQAQNIDRPLQLEVAETGGRAEGGLDAIRRLEDSGVVGVVGPLLEGALSEAAEGRGEAFPLISPTAFSGADLDGVLSLTGPDLMGAEMVASYAWDMGLERTVVIRPGTPEAELEASEFIRAFQSLGGIVSRDIVYAPGGTFFQKELQEAEAILPDGVFLPLPAADVRVLAPQITYYGLDTLGIQVLGTTGWASEEVLGEVDSRHTDGVIAATTLSHDDETVGFDRFRRAYESLHQKTLRSQIPGLGYDAASLLLEALKDGRTSPGGLRDALDGIRDFPGATGTFSIIDGRVLRRSHLVRIQNHELIDISYRFD